MDSLNKSWVTLIIVGVVFLVAAVAWELYQTSSGNRSEISIAVIDYQSPQLISAKLEKHLTSDPNFGGSKNVTPQNGIPDVTQLQQQLQQQTQTGNPVSSPITNP